MSPLTIRVVVECSNAASDSLTRMKEVVALVESSRSQWPSIEEWESILPQWFVLACGNPMSESEAREWVERWRKMTPAEQAVVEDTQRWSLPDWLYWMEPKQKAWSWITGVTRSAETLEIVVSVDGWPAPLGSLKWLARAAGADSVEVDSSGGC
jgi:hypothetical protein